MPHLFNFRTWPRFLAVVGTLLVASYAYACDCGCEDGLGSENAAVDGNLAGPFDFFTNYGEYMPRMHSANSRRNT